MRLTTRPRTTVEAPFVGVFDLFKVGIGPSSSHTVGPMRAAGAFLDLVASRVDLGEADGISCRLFGSLAMTGAGHATDVAVIAGLAGAEPESVDPDDIPAILASVRETWTIRARDGRRLAFDPATDLEFRKREFLPGHPNALEFILRRGAEPVLSRVYYSVGGGFVRTEGTRPLPVPRRTRSPTRSTAPTNSSPSRTRPTCRSPRSPVGTRPRSAPTPRWS